MKVLDIDDNPFHQMIYRSSGRNGVIRRVVLPFYKAKVDSLPEGVTSFVATSDLQGRERDKKSNRLVGEAVAEELLLLQQLEEIPKVDFVVLAGDLYDYPDCRKLGGTGDVTTVWNAFAEFFGSVVGVHGNHDTVSEANLATNTVILDGTQTDLNGVNIGGVCGIIGRVERNQRKTEEQFKKALQKVTSDKNDLVILHQGPDDTENNQKGEPFIREHLENNGSSLVIFGHCHWTEPLINIGNNQVLNVDNQLYLFTE